MAKMYERVSSAFKKRYACDNKKKTHAFRLRVIY